MSDDNAIAIIGFAGRFPKAQDLDQFWINLREGIEGITFFSDAELIAAGVNPEDLNQPNYVKARGVLEDVDLFDADFFGYSNRDAQWMDPQQRLFLECAHTAIEHAGYACGTDPLHMGVFAGCSVSSYLLINVLPSAMVDAGIGNMQVMIGNDKDYLASRVSYKLNLTGPSLTVQTACSTSLTAVHVACQSLLAGECDMALAGGSCVSLPQVSGYLHQTGSIASPDGHCRPFDAKANGTNGGSGVGVILLKRLSDAQADGDSIYALIRGSAINNDGTDKVGFTAPSQHGQAAVIAEALAVSGIAARDIGYIEAHGTATPVGDPIEVAALTEVFKRSTDQKSFCAIGSVKSNLGHLDAAAGIAGLLKTVQALRHRQIPVSLHYSAPNPRIDFANSPFFVPTKTLDWPSINQQPRRAGVSSFGIGGSNVHVVVEEFAQAPSETVTGPQLLVFSARSQTALQAICRRFLDFLQANPDINLADAAHTLRLGRTHHTYRYAIVAHDVANAIEQLNRPCIAKPIHARGVAFLLTGQGVPLVNAGRALYDTEPVFHDALEKCSEQLEPLLGVWLSTLLYPADQDQSQSQIALEQPRLAQPALLALEYGLIQLMAQFGIRPQAVHGHSLGQYSAAMAANIFTTEQALALVAQRGALMQALEEGAMLSVQLSKKEVSLYISDSTLEIAAINSPDSCVVAGVIHEIEALEHSLTQKGIACKRSTVNRAFHSKMTELCVDELITAVSRIEPKKGQIPVICNVTGKWLDDDATDPKYWGMHTREAVQFSEGLHTLATEPNLCWIELGPAAVLSGLARRNALPEGQDHVPTLTGQTTAQLLHCLGQLWAAGIAIDWRPLEKRRTKSRRIALPTYPFERQRHWINAKEELPVARPLDETSPARTISNTEASGSLQESLLVPRWISTQRTSSPKKPGKVLWMAAATGMAVAISEGLKEDGVELIHLQGPSDFFKAGNDDWDALIYALPLAHEGAAFANETLEHSFYNFMALAKRLAIQTQKSNKSLIVLTTHGSSAIDTDTLDPFQAAIMGAARELPKEVPWLSVRCIDLSLNTPVADALAEIYGSDTPFAVALTSMQRFESTLVPLPKQSQTSRVVYKRNGVYWIIGGTRGVGLAMARWLATNYHARLALSSRHAGQIINAIESTHASWLNERDTQLRIAHKIVPITERDGLANLLNHYCSALIWTYFSNSSFNLKPGQLVCIQALQSELKVQDSYQKFFTFMTDQLVRLGVAKRVETKLLIEATPQCAKAIGQKILAAHPGFVGMVDFMKYCAAHYPDVLSGQTSGISVLYPDGSPQKMLQAVTSTDEHTRLRSLIELAVSWVQRIADNQPESALRILEVGGGHGVLTDALLERVENIQYCFTDIGKSFVDRRRDRSDEAHQNNVTCKVLDISRPPELQGFVNEQFDLILAMNVVHATPDIEQTLLHLRSLLRPGGALVLLESVRQEDWVDMVWGLTPGWWAFEDDDLRPNSPLLPPATWQRMLTETGYVDYYCSARELDLEDTALIIVRRDPEIDHQQDQITSQVSELQSLGAQVLMLPADVTEVRSMDQARQAILAHFGDLNGVLNCAMAIDDTLLPNKTRAQAEHVLQVKAMGVKVLDQVLQDTSVDFVALFSSMSSIDPGPGQFDYAAANAVMDAYAIRTNKNSRRVVSINWNRWIDSGFVARLHQAHQASVLGYEPHGRVAGRWAFNTASDWILQEHAINNQPLLPGTALIECLTQGWLNQKRSYPLQIDHLQYAAPCWANAQGQISLTLRMQPSGPDKETPFEFEFQTFTIACALGAIKSAAQKIPPQHDLSAWRADCKTPYTTQVALTPATLGPRWQSLQVAQFNASGTRAMALIALPASLQQDLQHHCLHPALLDIGMGFACNGQYLPASIKRLIVYGPLPASFYSLVDIGTNAGHPCLDIWLVDEHGQTLVEIGGYVLRPPKTRLGLFQTIPGQLETLALRELDAPILGPDDVEIEVFASSLNFKDVLLAAGALSNDDPLSLPSLGAECAGRVSRLGDHAKQQWQIGDEVIATVAGAMAQQVITPSDQIYLKPANVCFADASTLPVAFGTAWFALHTLGQIKAEQKVLIHSATGGVGLAAVQIARQAGAEIFATAGSPDKRDYLHEIGIEHVMDSRSLAFVEQIKQITGGAGVDLALSGLAGEYLTATLHALAPGGIHLELGRRDIMQDTALSLGLFDKGIGFFSINFTPEHSAYRAVMAQILDQFTDGKLKPAPRTLFALSQAREAFELMLQSRHIGKVILAHDPEFALTNGQGTQARALTGTTSQSIDGLNDRQGAAVLTLALNSPEPQVAVVTDPALRASLLTSTTAIHPNTNVSNQVGVAKPQTNAFEATNWDTPTQQAVADIWQALLGHPVVNADANFFELRGDSLLAIGVLARVRQELGVALEPSALFSAPTVRELAALIDKSSAASSQIILPSGIVPLSRAGTKSPLFMAPPIMGTLFPYMQFAQLLEADRPVYGLSPRLTESGTVAWTTMQEQARFYVNDIVNLQPNGPYFLAGWSFGATVAFEIARQLQARGQKVALLATIDYPAQGSNKSNFLDFVRFFGASTAKSLISYLRDYAYLRQTRSAQKSSSWMRRITESAVISKVITPEAQSFLETEMAVPELMRIYRANASALSAYRPKSDYRGRIDLFRTEDHAAKRHNQALEWNSATTGEVVVHRVSGSHMTIMRSPHVERLALLLRTRLTEIESASKGQSP